MPQARCSIPISAFVCLALLCFAMLLSPTSVLGADRVIGAASSMATIFPESPPAAGDLAKEIALSAARGQSQSAQVVIVAGDQPLDIQRMEVSDLRSGGARIGKGSIEIRLVAYVEIKQNSGRGIKRPGLWPDPLIGFRPFTCPAGETRSLWVTVKVPRTAAPGQYQGSIKLYSAGSLKASVPIRLRVWHFALSKLPTMRTSYWKHAEAAFDFSVEPELFIQTVRLFAEYRVSTDLWPSWNFGEPLETMRKWQVLWYLEKDGRITCDISGLQRTIEAAVDAGMGTLQIGHGCWMGGEFSDMPLIDRRTGRLLPVGGKERDSALNRVRERLKPQELDGFPGTYFARLFLPQMCDWLQSKGLLDRAYMQLYDESVDPATFPELARLYQRYRLVEPRLKLLGLTDIHPFMAGVYDIWAPAIRSYDPETYDLLRQGLSLRGPKSFRATVTASSNGGSAAGFSPLYQPRDAYDGCDYSPWAPGIAPTAETPQWIRFDFPDPSGGIDGLRVVAFPFLPWEFGAPTNEEWVIEGSLDGQTFAPLTLTARAGVENGYSFSAQPYKAIRLSRAIVGSAYAPATSQDILALNYASPILESTGHFYVRHAVADGVREVEFLRQGLPLEAARPREQIRPAEMWEYAIGAGAYPSVCVDADASEIRALGWQSWSRGSRGYLNYGGAQWDRGAVRPKSEDPLVWTFPRGWTAGEAFIIYPGQKGALPSVRLARLRDGIDDYDYLEMLSKKQPNHPVLKQLREDGRQPYTHTIALMGGGSGRPPYDSADHILAAKQAVGEALDKLYAGSGTK